MPIYDAHIAVDWSAANVPKLGKDSIWISENGGAGLNLATRTAALNWISDRIAQGLKCGERLHIGLDFAFGLTRGAGQQIIGKTGWQHYWAALHDKITDSPSNTNNRFAVGGMLNAKTASEGPFWGCVGKTTYRGLKATRCVKGAVPWPHPFPAKRICDARVPGAQEIWKLAYTGSVGSQMLVGIAALERLRRAHPEISIWPFETDFARNLSKPILVTEIYPSANLFNFKNLLQRTRVPDEAQVMAVSGYCKTIDDDNGFAGLLEPDDLTSQDRLAATTEEGWILGQ